MKTNPTQDLDVLCYCFILALSSVLKSTWMQQQTPLQMQGRVISLLLFAAVALDPFSQALAGLLIESGLWTVAIAGSAKQVMMHCSNG